MIFTTSINVQINLKFCNPFKCIFKFPFHPLIKFLYINYLKFSFKAIVVTTYAGPLLIPADSWWGHPAAIKFDLTWLHLTVYNVCNIHLMPHEWLHVMLTDYHILQTLHCWISSGRIWITEEWPPSGPNKSRPSNASKAAWKHKQTMNKITDLQISLLW